MLYQAEKAVPVVVNDKEELTKYFFNLGLCVKLSTLLTKYLDVYRYREDAKATLMVDDDYVWIDATTRSLEDHTKLVLTLRKLSSEYLAVELYEENDATPYRVSGNIQMGSTTFHQDSILADLVDDSKPAFTDSKL